MASSKLPSATFAKLSPHPFLLANLQPADPAVPSKRTNGRQPAQARPPKINPSSLSHAHGSALVRIGDTTAICGVRAETLPTTAIPNYRAPEDSSDAAVNELSDYDLLVPNIELATGCAPNFLPGVPPTTLAQTLSTRVYSLLHSSKLINVDRLRIYEEKANYEESFMDRKEKADEADENMKDVDVGEQESAKKEVRAYWVLFIDILFISFDGNPFDAAWTAIIAALRNTSLPHARWDADREMVICSRQHAAQKLELRGLPLACTAAVFTAKEQQTKGSEKFWVLMDPDRLEENLCDEIVTIVVDRSGGGDGKMLGISKSGGTVVGADLMRKMALTAGERWEQLRVALN